MVTVRLATLQTDHHAIGQLSASKPQQSLLAVEARGAPACEDCTAVQRAVADFKQRLQVLETAKAERDCKQAQSLPSTQNHSGDTNDDRYFSSVTGTVSTHVQVFVVIHLPWAVAACINLVWVGL